MDGLSIVGSQTAVCAVVLIMYLMMDCSIISGILLTAEDNDATVFGVNKDFFSVDGFLALPCDVLGIEYYTVR